MATSTTTAGLMLSETLCWVRRSSGDPYADYPNCVERRLLALVTDADPKPWSEFDATNYGIGAQLAMRARDLRWALGGDNAEAIADALFSLTHWYAASLRDAKGGVQ